MVAQMEKSILKEVSWKIKVKLSSFVSVSEPSQSVKTPISSRHCGCRHWGGHFGQGGRHGGIEVDMGADMEVHRWTWWPTSISTSTSTSTLTSISTSIIDIDINVNINMEIQFGHGGWLIWSKLFWPKAYPACASSKLSEFILYNLLEVYRPSGPAWFRLS